MFGNLRRIRKENNFSIAGMSDVLGFKSKSTYCKKELGKVPFSLSEAKRISDLFGKSIDDIFFANKVS
jgi:Helix-turn-helix.